MSGCFFITAGDLDPRMLIDLEVNGAPEDVSDAILPIVLHWQLPDGTVQDVNLTPIDLTIGSVAMVWGPGNTDQVGAHRAQVIVTRGDGNEQTFPSDGTHVRWVVSARL